MKANEGETFYRIAIFASILFMVLFLVGGMVMVSQVRAEDNKTIDEPKFTRGGFPKILDEGEWSSQLIYDTIGACYSGTIRWVILNNPSLAEQPPNFMAQRAMVEHCFCVMDKIRKEHKLEEYKVKVFDPDWTGETFMLKAIECVKKYKTLPNFFADIEILPDNKTTITPEKQIPDNSSSTKDAESLPDQKQKEFQEESPLIFQG
jgi:hypothetical protein